MRHFIFAAIPLAVLLFSPLYAQEDTPAQDTPEATEEEVQNFLGMFFDQYATMTGGFYLDTRCEHLSSEDNEIFTENRATVVRFLETFVAGDMMERLDQGARSVGGNEDLYPCGEGTEGIVTATFEMSKNLAYVAEEAFKQLEQ